MTGPRIGIFALALLLSLSTACRAARQFKPQLLAALAEADRIEVVEQSDWQDLVALEPVERRNRPGLSSSGYPVFTYASVVLDKAGVEELRSAVAAMSDVPPAGMAMCVPLNHHAIRLYRDGNLASSIEVCFHCGQISWSGSREQPPAAFFGVAARAIRRAGLPASEDWTAKARKWKAEAETPVVP